MSTHPKKARHPWGGYRITFQKRGSKWRFHLVSKFNVTVYTSPLDYDRQIDCREPAKAFKAEYLRKEQERAR
jgi:hypothetical protein